MGNCGVGFAPCRSGDRDLLCDTMEGVEDIPGAVMREGLTWTWETFPEYLDALAAQPHDIDVGMLVPHSPVRVYAMGTRGAHREIANDEDIAAMGELIRAGMASGALGFASSRTPVDRRCDGQNIPSFNVAERELVAAALAVKDAGGGLFQMITERGMTGLSAEEEFAVLRTVSHASGLPITFTVMEGRKYKGHGLRLLELAQEHNRSGGALIHPQFLPRPLGMIASFDLTSNPFMHCPSYRALAHLPLERRVTELRKPEIKARIIAEKPGDALLPLTALTRQFDLMFELSDPPSYEPAAGSSVAERARTQGRLPEDLAYDLLLARDGRAMMLVAASNFVDGSLESVLPFFDDPNAVIGLGDGGAHYGLICDASYPTYVLTHWARDRAGRQVPLEQPVKAMTSTPAKVIGLRDRGVIAPGYKADINVVDHAGLTLHAPFIVDNLPAGGRRLEQTASGYRWTFVGGTAILRDDQPTGALPGRLVRHARKGMSQAA